MENALTNPLPPFVKIEGTPTCFRLISRRVHMQDPFLKGTTRAIRYLYWRDAGRYSVGLEEKRDGFLYVDEPAHSLLHGKRLVEIAEEEWRALSGEFAPESVPNPHIPEP